MKLKLKHITIKPTHKCVQNCPYCVSRQKLLRSSADNTLSISEWKRIFIEANDLGVEYIDISGGEPVLYPENTELIKMAKSLGWFVSMNSTGYKIIDVLDDLFSASLDQVIISLVSINEKHHDELRGKKGSFIIALKVIEHLKNLPVRVVIHLIVNRYSYRELPDIIDFAFSNNVNSLALVYPENDWKERNLLLTRAEIAQLREEIIPECLQRYSGYRPVTDGSHLNLTGLYGEHNSSSDFSTGIFWKDPETAKIACNKPENFALIYPNGDVYPCNGVEYDHIEPMGNLKNQSFIEIWEGKGYEKFRKTKTEFCIKCPIVHHTGLAITTVNNPPYMTDSLITTNDQPSGS